MKPSEFKLLNLLSNNDVTFFIPPYQRNYEWTDEQCEVFLNDVIKTYKLNDSGDTAEHFFGCITYFQTKSVFGQPNKLVLIDGQQRITTVMLFLAALRDIFNTNEDELGHFIDSKYLKNDNVKGDTEYKIKLKQVETDWAVYSNIILSKQLNEKEKNSSIYRNYQYFKNKLLTYQKEGYDLSALIEKGLDKFSLITIQLDPEQNKWENPQEIFESMNSLGKPLSLADLVRNYLLLGLNADEQDKLYNNYWIHIERVIPGQVSNFIRDYMQGIEKQSFPKATESNYKTLYGSFKHIFEKLDSTNLLRTLSEYSNIYSFIINGESTGEQKVDNELKDLGKLNVTTAYSFLLFTLYEWKNKNFTTQDVVDILHTFKIYCLRRRLLGLASAENKNFPMLVKKIPQLINSADKQNEMFKILSDQESNLRLPNDIEIVRTLENMNFYNFKYCKFFLSLIEEKITKCRPNQEDENLQIEHIMPQKLSEQWKKNLGNDFETIHQELVHTIGNLTLIRHNRELGQKSFEDKKEIYKNNAGLQIAQNEIIDKDKWDADTIKQRTSWISNFLVEKVIPIPLEMRKTNNFRLKEGRGLSFQELQLIGLDIYFADDPSIKVRVVGDKEVEFEGKIWKLSQITRELYTRRGTVNASGSYQGSRYWKYDDVLLYDIV
ncbi:MAG: DUF262 domain-containing HNH endonuclease family protein [Cyanobacteria bacterium RUI128]|nr:DUF262 domain-containing HNH endonuclease family protein [Cyanobacteria bacterium RUI128]